jgi:hypothetical protein
MTLFLLIWVGLVAAAAGLAVGALWGRPPRKGSCAGSAVAGCALVAYGDCRPGDPVRRHTSSRVG